MKESPGGAWLAGYLLGINKKEGEKGLVAGVFAKGRGQQVGGGPGAGEGGPRGGGG